MNAPDTVDLLAAAVDEALWCDPTGVIRLGEVDVTDQVKAAERTGLLLFGVDEHGNEVWVPSAFGEMVLRRAAAVVAVPELELVAGDVELPCGSPPPSPGWLAVAFALFAVGAALGGEVGGLLLFAALVGVLVWLAREWSFRRAVR